MRATLSWNGVGCVGFTKLSFGYQAKLSILFRHAQPDFYYSDANTAVYIDGPPHDEPSQKADDEDIKQRLISAGYLVIRFHHAADWNAIFDQYADVFGQRKGV